MNFVNEYPKKIMVIVQPILNNKEKGEKQLINRTLSKTSIIRSEKENHGIKERFSTHNIRYSEHRQLNPKSRHPSGI